MSLVMTSIVRLKSTLLFCLTLGLAALPCVASASSFEAKLHVPWTLLQSRAQTAIEGQNLSGDVADRTINAAGLDWHLTGIHVDATTNQAKAAIGQTTADFTFPGVATIVSIQKISVDQVITREVDGVTLNIHVQATCGPLALRQDAAQGALHFGVDWSTGSPVVALNSLDLNWAAGTWTSNDIICDGPSGMGETMKTEILNQMKDASAFKPMLASFLQDGVQPRLQTILSQIRQPITVSTGQGKVQFAVGAMAPVATGILANIVSGSDANNFRSRPRCCKRFRKRVPFFSAEST